jgi:hypothetical protein
MAQTRAINSSNSFGHPCSLRDHQNVCNHLRSRVHAGPMHTETASLPGTYGAVRLLREELQHLQEAGSYVGEVIKVICRG